MPRRYIVQLFLKSSGKLTVLNMFPIMLALPSAQYSSAACEPVPPQYKVAREYQYSIRPPHCSTMDPYAEARPK